MGTLGTLEKHPSREGRSPDRHQARDGRAPVLTAVVRGKPRQTAANRGKPRNIFGIQTRGFNSGNRPALKYGILQPPASE